MQFRNITYVDLVDIAQIPVEFQIVWSDFVLDARTVKAADLKHFAESFGLWTDMSGKLGAHSDAIVTHGSMTADNLIGTVANDVMFGDDGDDVILGGDGADFLIGNAGNDRLDLGDGFFNRGKGGDGNDVIKGGSGMDWVHGNAGNDRLIMRGGDDKAYGGDGDDTIRGGGGKDWLQGADGNDLIIGGAGRDTLHGGNGDDVLIDRMGKDWLDGGAGNDRLIVRSDAGTPDQKLADADFSALNLNKWTDRLTGGTGADEFHFIYEMNTANAVAARNLNPDGTVNWMDVARENANPHDHWVDWGGLDKIDDFSFIDGDSIIIEGHTAAVQIAYLDTDNDGQDDSTMITVYSDQASQMAAMGMGGQPMAHDQDLLGFIFVDDAILMESDLDIRSMSMEARFDEL